MAQSLTEKSVTRLRQLKAVSPAIEDCWLISSDGLFMANAVPSSFDEFSHFTRFAVTMSQAECVAHVCGPGTLHEVCICTKTEAFLVLPVGTIAVLAILFNRRHWHESLIEDVAETIEALKCIWDDFDFSPLPFD